MFLFLFDIRLNGGFAVAGKKEPSVRFREFVVKGCECFASQLDALKWYIRLYGTRQSTINRLSGELSYLDPLIRRAMKLLGLRQLISGRYFMATLILTCKNPSNATQARRFRQIIAERKGDDIAKRAIKVERKTSWKVDRELIADDPFLMQELCRIAGETESLTIGPVTKKAKREGGVGK